ncbi:retrovirus-related pol polyprotein from transposon TNT 1-94 [Tanacetum coccineum]|uniref:Retrovirus-related pol polyprotein from transposon TNT 1-94 n=1 Tax=Tanacetum coccineum TaxID=301880 RepID=A0ABQ5ADB7_9ASTR
MNDFKRNKHFLEKIASNLKFLNNLQPEWSRHVTIVHQTKDLHITDYTHLYDFLKYDQKEVDELRVERLGKTHDPLALMVNSNNPYNFLVFPQDQPSPITYMQQQQPNNNFIPQPSFIMYSMQQPMQNPEDITNPTTAMNMALIAQPGNQNGYNAVQNIGNQNPNGNGNVVAARAEGNAIGNNGNQIWCYNCRGLGHFARNCTVRPRRRDTAYLQTQLLISQKEEVGIQLQAENFDLMAAAADLDEIEEVNANCILMANFVEQNKGTVEQSPATVEDPHTSTLQTELEQCKYDKISYDKAHNDMQQKIERLQAQLGDLKGKSKDTSCASDTLNPLSQKLENKNVELEFQVVNYVREIEHLKTTYKNLFDYISVTRTQTKSIIDSLQDKLHDTVYENAKLRAQLFDKASEQKDTTKGTNVNTKFANQSILGKPFLQPIRNNFIMRQPNAFKYERPKFSNNRVPQKVDKTNDLSKPVTSNSVPITKESKVVENDNVIAPGMFRIDPRKTSREDKFVPINKVRASVRTNPITVSQPHAVPKKDVNSNSNGSSSTGVVNTAKTKRPQPRSNTKNDRVPSVSKSRCIKNKQVEVEEHHRNLMLSMNKKHISSECNNVKLAIRNDNSEIVCAMWSKERLASPKPRKPRTYLRWSPTGRMFDLKGKIIGSSDAECHSDYSNGDNAYSGCLKHMTRNLKLLINFVWKFLGTFCFRNDHVAAILGYGDLQWGNILITRVYFVEGLGHNLFSVGQFCDSDLEVAFRRNTCFVRNLEGVDLLKGNRTTNLYTINLHEMASASPICLMAHATSTKSWLWHQHLSHLNFDTINDLARNDLVTGLPKSKDEAPEVIKTFLKKIQVLLQAPVIIVRTDNGIEFKNQVLQEYFDSVNISHQASFVRTPQQNGVVERRNRTLVEAARTMLIFSHAPLFLWAEAIATAKPDISFLHVFGALCYPKNDREDIRKLGAKGDISFFIGYSANSCAYRVYNRRTKKIMETMNVTFDELFHDEAFETKAVSKPGLQGMTSGQISSGLDLTYAPSTITSEKPSEHELDFMFEAMYDDFMDIPSTSQNVDELKTQQQHVQQQDNQVPLNPEIVVDSVLNAMLDENQFVNPFATPSTSCG